MKYAQISIIALLGLAITADVSAADGRPPIGYTDTPYLPDSEWRVHDIDRPRPETVRPVTGMFVQPPEDAIVLFDGTGLSAWVAPDGSEPSWIVENGTMRPPPRWPGAGNKNLLTRRSFGDVQLHLEWKTPREIEGSSQGRGNSGVILMQKYEVQVLDSYNNVTYADGQAGAMYGFRPPLVNASLPPGEWQSYDIIFEAPEFDDSGTLISPAFVTVIHNGVLLHHREAYPGATIHKRLPTYELHAPKLPLQLQDHRDAVEFRNVWVREISD